MSMWTKAFRETPATPLLFGRGAGHIGTQESLCLAI